MAGATCSETLHGVHDEASCTVGIVQLRQHDVRHTLGEVRSCLCAQLQAIVLVGMPVQGVFRRSHKHVQWTIHGGWYLRMALPEGKLFCAGPKVAAFGRLCQETTKWER